MFFICSQAATRLERGGTTEDEMGRRERIALALAAATVAAAALAAESIGYSYDARGRLIAVKHSGSVNNEVATNYTYDDADNRTLKNTSGVP